MALDPHPSAQPATDRVAASADWTRREWAAYADRLLGGAMAWASPGCARITPPGDEGGYGRAVDGLEGFARTFLLGGFRIAGERGAGVDHLIDFFLTGIRTGVDPQAPDRWVRMEEHAQAKVEAASIALILDLTRPWIWDRLDEVTRERVTGYLAPVVGDETYPRNNWLWFRIVVQTFLRSVGGPWSPDDIAADLARHDSYVRADGWLSDGDERSYDHYAGWAMHLYPVLWSRMAGAAELAGGRTAGDVAALDRFLQDAVHLVGADGSPLIQGRSLIYRFAAAAPFWAGALAEVPSVPAGALRHAADRIVRHFADRGVPDERGLLTMGWHHEWRTLAQSYSGPGSPYWAAKGLLGLALPADHPVWTAPAEPLPAERGDFVRALRAPGWAVSGTADDGIVRIANHGTDHAADGALVGDSPLYARIGYSTASSPLLDERAWTDPLDQALALVDDDGEATHRAAMELLETRVEGPVAIAASRWCAHLLEPDDGQRNHGSGLAGTATPVARIVAVSIVRGAWEVRLATVDRPAAGIDLSRWRLRWGGWPLAGDAVSGSVSETGAEVRTAREASAIRSLMGAGPVVARVVERPGSGPLGDESMVPVLEREARIGEWAAALLTLTRPGSAADESAAASTTIEVSAEGGAVTARISWPDGVRTAVTTAIPFAPDSREAHGA